MEQLIFLTPLNCEAQTGSGTNASPDKVELACGRAVEMTSGLRPSPDNDGRWGSFSGLVQRSETNRTNDFGLLILWSNAREFSSEICLALEDERLEILGRALLHWPLEDYWVNMNRLYQAPVFSNTARRDKAFMEKTGPPPYEVIVVRDSKPDYRFAPSSSGVLGFRNMNLKNFKEQTRTKFDLGFGIHATDNFSEFRRQSVLLLGLANVEAMLPGNNSSVLVRRSLEGWPSWPTESVFLNSMNAMVDWVCLRDNDAPISTAKDLDVLALDWQAFASCSGMVQSSKRHFGGKIKIGGYSDEACEIDVDIRFPGDAYFPEGLAHQMIETRSIKAARPVLSPFLEYYSLLYHVVLHKNSVADRHLARLQALQSRLGPRYELPKLTPDIDSLRKVLNDLMLGQAHVLEYPKDRWMRDIRGTSDFDLPFFDKFQPQEGKKPILVTRLVRRALSSLRADRRFLTPPFP